MATDKIVKQSALQKVLENLFTWLPFKKTKSDGIQIGDIDSNDDTLFGVGDKSINSKNIFEVKKDGKIYVLDVEKDKQESLLDLLNKKDGQSSYVINNEEEWAAQKDTIMQQLGAVVYFNEVILEYKAGVYIVGMDANNGGAPILISLASAESVIEERVEQLENFMNNPISQETLETITGIDIDGNGDVGTVEDVKNN